MQKAEIIFVSLLTMAAFGGIGLLIGRNRKLGTTWSFVLGAVLGWIGWIVADCSPRAINSATTKNARWSAFELALSWIFLVIGLIAFLMGIAAIGSGTGITYLIYVILGTILCGLGGVIMRKQ